MLFAYARFATVLPLALFALVAGASAQTPPTTEPSPGAPAAPAPPSPAPSPAGSPNLNIMIVDVQTLLQNSKAAKIVRSQIETKRAEYAKEIQHQDEILRQERDTLQREQASLSPEVLNKRGREFQAKVNELDRNVQSKRQALEKSYNDAIQKIQATLLKIIEDIAKTRKANLVLQRSELVLFDQAFDITDEVLQKLDEQMPTMTVEFVTPVASAAPAPGATPASAPGSAPAGSPTAPAAPPAAGPTAKPKKK
jgi:outer membrane protein